MRVAIVQYDIAWQNPSENFHKINSLLADVKADVIVLPEMFNTGFNMQPEQLSKSDQLRSLSFLQQLSEEKQASVLASSIWFDGEAYFNRLFYCQPQKRVQHYDKRHLFAFAGEDKHFSRGDQRLQVEQDGVSMLPLICYDLRFPVYSRNISTKPYDVLFYVANWPEARIEAWDALLKARAIENQCFVVADNRVGKDHNGIEYNGHSMVIDPYGKLLGKCPDNQEQVLEIDLDMELLKAFRKKFPVLTDADDFEITN